MIMTADANIKQTLSATARFKASPPETPVAMNTSVSAYYGSQSNCWPLRPAPIRISTGRLICPPWHTQSCIGIKRFRPKALATAIRKMSGNGSESNWESLTNPARVISPSGGSQVLIGSPKALSGRRWASSEAS